MSKRKGAKRRTRGRRPRLTRARLTIALCLCLVAVATAASRSPSVRHAVGLAPLSEPAVQAPPLTLSKEYIYAGSRLVATEEPTPLPTPAPAGPPPTGLLATASFPSIDTAVVRLTWSAPASGSPTSYVVERASSRGANGQLQYAALNPPATSAATEASPYVDQTAAGGTVYLYRVRAVYAGGFSGYSNQDLATTVRYTGDDPLVGVSDPQGRPRSIVRAANLTELRTVVEAVRALAGVGAGVWKDNPAPLLHGQILAAHFSELRTNLNPALATLGVSEMPAPAGAGIGQGQPVRAVHVQDVRDKVR